MPSGTLTRLLDVRDWMGVEAADGAPSNSSLVHTSSQFRLEHNQFQSPEDITPTQAQ